MAVLRGALARCFPCTPRQNSICLVAPPGVGPGTLGCESPQRPEQPRTISVGRLGIFTGHAHGNDLLYRVACFYVVAFCILDCRNTNIDFPRICVLRPSHSRTQPIWLAHRSAKLVPQNRSLPESISRRCPAIHGTWSMGGKYPGFGRACRFGHV